MHPCIHSTYLRTIQINDLNKQSEMNESIHHLVKFSFVSFVSFFLSFLPFFSFLFLSFGVGWEEEIHKIEKQNKKKKRERINIAS